MKFVRFILLGGFMIAFTGCVSRGTHESEVSNLQTQLAQTEAALKAEQEQNKALQAQLSGGGAGVPMEPYKGAMYKSPSGFEVPAVNIQKALKGTGYYSGAIDGKLGPDSREALRNFQRDNGLTADGVCGRQTWNKLKTHLT